MITDNELNNALNVICEYAKENLPEGYEIELRISSGECSAALTDSDYEELEFDSDSQISAIRAMCEAAVEHADSQG